MAIANNFFNGRPTFLNDFANGQTLDNRITFLRSGAATYYDGKSSALAEQNLLLQSNGFSTSPWALTTTSLAQNVNDPSGTANNAWTLTATVGSGLHYLINNTFYTTLPSVNYTQTVYLQAGTNNFAILSVATSTGANYIAIPINLTSGSVALGTPVVGTTFNYVSSSITQVGSTAWYRIALTFNTTSTSVQEIIQMSNSATPTIGNFGLQANWTAVGTETLLVYGTQAEQRSTATAYNQTTTTAINNFIPTLQSAPINTPRFDFNPVTGESLGFLVEGSSTNLLTYSEDFTNAYWAKTATTIISNATIAPDGTQSAQLMVLNTTSVSHYFGSAASINVSNGVYTCSYHVKYYGYQFIQLGNNSSQFCSFDLINGTIGTPTGCTPNIIPLGNGFYRISITYTVSVGATLPLLLSSNSLTAGWAPSFAGNGFNGYYVWGAQLEATQNSGASSALTSYIKTTSATVTRSADYPTITGTNFTSFFNNSQGTWYVESQAGYYDGNDCEVINILNVSGLELQRVIAQFSTNTSSIVGYTTGTVQLLPTSNATVNGVGQYNKISYTYTNNALVVSELGVTPLSSSTNNSVPTATQMAIGYRYAYSRAWLNGHIKKIAYYPTAMTGANLQALTGS